MNTPQTAAVINKPEQIEAFRLRVLYSALKLEARGMRRSHGSSALRVFRDLGITKARTAAAALADVEAYLSE